MLEKVEVRTDQGDLLELVLDDPTSGYVIEDIENLEPVKANIVSSSYAKLKGEQYQSSKREKRNPIFKIELKSSTSGISNFDLRWKLYHYFMPESNVNLRFRVNRGFNEELVVDISGRVETFDCPLFVQNPKATISILCFDPDLVDVDEVSMAGMTSPYNDTTAVEYIGTVETGVRFLLYPDRALSAFTIRHIPPGEEPKDLEFAAPLEAGDVLSISTIPGSKGATLLRDEAISSMLYGVSPYSTWHQFKPGSNYVGFFADGAPIPWVIEYNNRYGGL